MPPTSANDRREQFTRRLDKLRKRKRDGDADTIEHLQKLVEAKDEELVALTSEEVDKMDVDESYDPGNSETGGGGSGGGEGGENGGSDKTAQSIEGGSGEEPLFVQPDDDEDPVFRDDEGNDALYSFPGTTGGGDVETVAWASGRHKYFINRHGKKSVARYRLESCAFPAAYEESLPDDDCVSLPKNRHGDEKTGTRPTYTRRHIRGIFGVAWKCKGVNISQDDLQLIDPDNVSDWKDVRTYVLIAWEVEPGKTEKTWETRSALRQRWGRDQADRAIYEAAKEAEERYEESVLGRRPARTKSPTVGLADSHVREQREQSSPLRATTRAKSSRARTPKDSDRHDALDLTELKAQFLADFADLFSKNPDTFTPSETRRVLAAWKEEKEELGL